MPRRSLEIQILDVSYEELIGNQETQSKRLLEFLGIAWDDRAWIFTGATPN